METVKHGTRDAFKRGCRCKACQRWFRLTARHLLGRPLVVETEVCGKRVERRWK